MTAFYKLCIEATLKSGNLTGKKVVTKAQLAHCLPAFLSLFPLTALQAPKTKQNTSIADLSQPLQPGSRHYPAATSVRSNGWHSFGLLLCPSLVSSQKDSDKLICMDSTSVALADTLPPWPQLTLRWAPDDLQRSLPKPRAP